MLERGETHVLPLAAERERDGGRAAGLEPAEAEVLRLAEERLVVGKREVVTGVVRVRTTVETREEPVDLLLARDAVEVERRPVGRFVDEAPPVREEGDLIVVPVLEEVLVVEKRLRLTEELVIRRSRTEERHRETVALRREQAVVERLAPDTAADEPDNQSSSSGNGSEE